MKLLPIGFVNGSVVCTSENQKAQDINRKLNVKSYLGSNVFRVEIGVLKEISSFELRSEFSITKLISGH